MNNKRKLVIRVVSIILCAMIVLGVFSILFYTIAAGG